LPQFFARVGARHRFLEYRNALAPLRVRAFPKYRQRMLRIAGVAEEGSQKHAVILQDFQFRMHRQAQALAESGLSVQPFPNSLRMQALLFAVRMTLARLLNMFKY
jgi:hypothetical protein